MRILAELGSTSVFEWVQAFGDGAPKHIRIYIVVVMSQHAAELTELWKFGLRIFGVERIAEFSRGLADSFQAPLDRILRFSVGCQLRRSHTFGVGANP